MDQTEIANHERRGLLVDKSSGASSYNIEWGQRGAASSKTAWGSKTLITVGLEWASRGPAYVITV